MAKTNDFVVQGTLELEVSPDGRHARIMFSPAAGGESWSAARIVELIESRQITEHISRDELEKALRPAKQGRPTEVTVASATLPVEPTAETVEWNEMPVPGEVAAKAAEVFAAAGPPDISVEVVEKVKRKKTITKKPALPFLPAKTETVEVVERETRKQKVFVNPAVLGTGFAEAGTSLGIVEPARPGTPGHDIHGNVLQPGRVPDPYFYAGSNVTRKRDELVADKTGLVRYGDNWVELIPFAGHDWSLSLSPDKSTCYIAITPGDPRAPLPDYDEIARAAAELSCDPATLLSPREYEELFHTVIARGKPVERLSISSDRDAEIRVDISGDKLRATLSVSKGRGKGTALRLKDVGAAINAAGLKGISNERIRNDVTAFYESAETDLVDYLLVEGRAPGKGADSVVDFALDYASPKETLELKERASAMKQLQPGIDSLLEFPVEAADSMARVIPEQKILSYSPATQGEPGVDVRGTALPGIKGASPKLKLYENVGEQNNTVFSKIDGVLDLKTTESGEIWIRVRPHRDAEISVALSADRMSATLTVAPHEGSGRAATLEAIRGAIGKAGIVEGIEELLIPTLAGRAAQGEPIESVIIARGRPAVRAGQRRVKYLVALPADHGVVIRKDGRADYRNRDQITRVAAGTEIAEIVEPSGESVDGVDVTGRVIPAGTVSDAEIACGKNVERTTAPDGRTILVARTAGELVVENNLVDVRTVRTIKGDVDLQTGNIKFNGPVTVTGNVTTGFFVMADGEVKIGEGVEAGLVSSNENVVVRQGIRGAGKAVVRTKQNLSAAFCEQATLLAVNDIRINNACVRSRIKCNGTLTLVSDKGTLLGGVVQCRLGLEAQNIGSERGGKTHISFGQNYLISDRIEVETKEIEKAKQKVAKLEAMIREADRSHDKSKLATLFHQKTALLKIMEKRNLLVFTLREKFEEHFPSRVVVRGTAYPGTVLESHGRTLELTVAKKAVVFEFNTVSGRIEEKPLKDAGG